MEASWLKRISKLAEESDSFVFITKFGIKASKEFKDLSLDKRQSNLACFIEKSGLISALDLWSSRPVSEEQAARIDTIKNGVRYLNKCFQSNSLLE